jgi:hypothetical protein
MASSSNPPVRRWDPGAFLSLPRAAANSTDGSSGSSSSAEPASEQAMIVLNLPINRLDVFLRIWSQSTSDVAGILRYTL